MAIHVNRPRRQFIEEYPDLVDNIQVKLIDYVKNLLKDPSSTAIPEQGPAGPSSTEPVVTRKPWDLEIRDDFPVMPAVDINDDWLKVTYENIIRQYLTIHYSKCNPVVPRPSLTGMIRTGIRG